MRRIHPSKFLAAALITGLIATITLLAAAPEAKALDYLPDTPCPDYSIQDVFDDPTGDWDGDGINNRDELLNGENPCVKDKGTFCKANPTLCTRAKWYRLCENNVWTRQDVYDDPKGDWDGDGISNLQELKNGTSPCLRPCPNPSTNELNAEPHGDWDGDGYSNIAEVRAGTNPCNSRSHPRYQPATHNVYSDYYYNPHGYYVYVPAAPRPLPTPVPTPKPIQRTARTICPFWTRADVNAQPNHDWDGDGISNIQELRNGTNPCVSNRRVRQLPRVGTPHPNCPVGYPHYHPGTGKCHINPIRGNR